MLLALIVFILAGLVPARAGAGRDREPVYLSRESTSLVNGVFIWLVFLRHMGQYHPELGRVDACAPSFFAPGGNQTGVCSYTKAVSVHLASAGIWFNRVYREAFYGYYKSERYPTAQTFWRNSG